MRWYLIHFATYHKIYLIVGAVLLLLALLPTKENTYQKTQKFLYLALTIWIICFAYKLNTGQDIVYLFNKKDQFGSERQPTRKVGGPFNKYYSNEAGRKAKNGD
jgi:hypothetical protein